MMSLLTGEYPREINMFIHPTGLHWRAGSASSAEIAFGEIRI